MLGTHAQSAMTRVTLHPQNNGWEEDGRGEKKKKLHGGNIFFALSFLNMWWEEEVDKVARWNYFMAVLAINDFTWVLYAKQIIHFF